MDSVEANDFQQGVRLRVAFMNWAGCLGGLALLLGLAIHFSSALIGNAAFIFYLGAGFYLSRKVLRNIVEWHPMYNTLDNVTSDKLRFFSLWPFMYLVLFARLGINKVL